MNKKGNGSPIMLVFLLISVAVIILLAVISAQKDVEQMQKLKEAEVIQNQRTEELRDAMQGIKNDIEAGYGDLDLQIDQ
ncbi:MAG: hypothetical protein K5697_09805 [Lachnospiraceae bacterium]|nr:hypothetical protein [Lachnospiraceae bacterium]